MLKLILLLLAIIITTVNLCVGINFDCDFVNDSGNCRCNGNGVEYGWKIQCPNNVKLHIRPLQQEQQQAELFVHCHNEAVKFSWDIVEGVDLNGFRITVLWFQYCNLELISDSFLAFFQKLNIDGSNLKKLGIHGTKLLKFPNLTNLKRLESLFLNYNGLETIPRDVFANNQNLTEISFQNNKVSAIGNALFPDTLTSLNLGDNIISSLKFESLANLKNLQVLNLDSNPLTNLDPNAFTNLIELKELSLNNVDINEFPQLANLIKLEQLIVDHQEDSFTDTSFTIELTNLPNLWKVHLKNLDLAEYPKLKNLSNLTELNLSRNKIKIFPKTFAEFPKLRILDVSENEIAELDSPSLENIVDLNLSGNRITHFSGKSEELVKIDLSTNRINSIEDKTFVLLPNLTWLDLSNNKISLNKGFQQSNVPNIGTNQSPFKNNLKLQNLFLKNNEISSIYDDWRISLKYLTDLYLEYNRLTHLSAKDFSFTQKNITVILSGNSIRHIDMTDALVHLVNDSQRNVKIHLLHVRLNCDCQTIYLKNFRSNTYKIIRNDLICAKPRNSFQSSFLTAIKDTDFRCQIHLQCPFGCECWQRPADSTILIDCSNRSLNMSKFGLPQINNIDSLLDHLTPTRLNRKDWKLVLDLSANNITELTDRYASTISRHLNIVDLSGNQLTSLSFLRALKNNPTTNFSLANNPFPCYDCLGFQKHWRDFSDRLDVDNMTCIFSNESDVKHKQNSLHALELGVICPKLAISNQIHYFVIVVSLLLISVLIIIYLTRERMRRQRELKEIINLLNGRKINKDEETKDDPLNFLFDPNYEIKKNSFLIDKHSILGKGEFGEVFKGLLHGVDKTVAFKTVRSDRGTGPLKALVSEVKILMYIGPHEHLVTLLGVYRDEIASGILYVAIEFCEFGSLESFLRKNKTSFSNNPILNPKVEDYADASKPSTPIVITWKQTADEFKQSLCSIKSLLMWSEQIAIAMEYLGQKNVIHSDLATRNVLLTSEGNAKVTDFGLSRRTYNYTEYIKTAKDPLPWRWLAIESLQTNTFSTKSDMWAYGITLWEIFSLGDIPYPGMAHTMEFAQELENGLRNFKPKLASEEIYDIMVRCWHLHPEMRPSFSSMKITFNYAFSNGAECLEGKLSQEVSLDDIAIQLAGDCYTTI